MKSILFSIKKYFTKESLARARRRIKATRALDRRKFIQRMWMMQGLRREVI